MKTRTPKFTALALGAAMGFASFGALTATPAHADNIVATAKSTGMFKTLLAAAQAAGVAPMLMNDKNLTVFAPTDAAFDKLPAGTVQMLLKPENKDTLKKILAYHVLTMKVPAKKAMALPSGTNIKTAEGEKFILRKMDGKLMIDPGVGAKATVIKPNVMADNGIVHVIDTVLIPPSVQRAMAEKAKMMMKKNDMSTNDKMDMDKGKMEDGKMDNGM